MKQSCSKVTMIAALALLFLISGSYAAEKSTSLPSVGIHKFEGQAHSLTLERQFIAPSFKIDGNKAFNLPQSAKLLQGGEDIAGAVEIPALPYTTTGTTIGYADDYDEVCPLASTSPDVVYYYVATGHDLLDISLCGAGTDYRTHLWVYENSEAQLVDCNRFSEACGGELKSALSNVEVFTGNTYYIVIDGDYGASGNYELDITSAPAPASFARHPSLADAGNGSMIFTYEYESVLDTALYWLGTDNGGVTVSPAIYWSFETLPTLPSVKHFSGNQFYGTFRAPYQTADSGAPTYLIDIADPLNPDFWGLSYWDWSAYGWHDQKMADIATNNGRESWEWGMIAMIHSTHYETPAIVDAPHISYPTTNTGQATISWFTGVDGCNSVECDIDPITFKGYSAFDVYDTDSSQWVLFLRQDFTDNWAADPNAWVYDVGSINEHVQYPSVAAYNGRVIVATEYWAQSGGEDRDIIVWMTSDSDMINMDYTVLVNSPDAERFPKIEHVANETFILSFHRNDSFFTMYTMDNGATWTDPQAYTLPGSYSIGDYRFSDFSDNGTYAIWQYQADGDSSIMVRFDYTQVVDGDMDGWPDATDNCPAVYNPTQGDADGQPPGDACCCLGIRGNSNGDPEDKTNISDITFLVEFLFGIPSGDTPPCPYEGNANGDPEEKINITDVTYMTEYLFGVPPGPEPPACPGI